MKRWVWAVLVFLVAGVVGGYSVAHYHENELQYNRNIVNGRTAIEQKNYPAAENYFKRALTKKKDDTMAQSLLSQTKKFTRAESEFKNNEFTSALLDYKDVTEFTNASRTLHDRGEERVKLVTKIRHNIKKFNQYLKKAKKFNAEWDFYDSNAKLDLILSHPDIEQSYYEVIYEQALILQKFNNAGMVADQNAFSTTVNPNSSKLTPNPKKNITPHYDGPGSNSDATEPKTNNHTEKSSSDSSTSQKSAATDQKSSVIKKEPERKNTERLVKKAPNKQSSSAS